ncbi:lamin tail domain-containing protein [Microbacterium sp. B2969]|uniref:Lamin tail domain-containing protein n=1 Tax=Microbacterium alkaliflavum TaxID=3248839 RepID=A0ABW7Q5X9_9MICO
MLRPVAASSLVLCLALAASVPAEAAEPPDAVAAAAGDVVISEIAAEAPTHGFFELQNGADHAVDLSGWTVYRCDAEGLRVKPTAPDAVLDGVVLVPGERFLAAQAGGRWDAAPDAVFAEPLSSLGFGLVLLAPDGAVADGVGVYPSEPAPTEGECGDGNLPVALAGALDESWQRTASGDWVRARATPGEANAEAADTTTDEPVRIDEIAAAGPAGHGDDLVELRNTGGAPVDVGGWRVYRCTALGTTSAATLQYSFPEGRSLAAGERFVVVGPDFTGEADARAAISLADVFSGVLIATADGRRVDGVTVSSERDTACQTGDEKLSGILDYRSGESWQRTPAGEWLIAPRTPGARNAATDTRLAAEAFAYPEQRGVAISELATDPALDRNDYARHTFVELGNYGTDEVDVSGWRLVACTADGFRSTEDLATIAPGTTIPPGATWLAALAGTDAASRADAVFWAPFALAGAGVWVEDAHGDRVDSVGVYHRNEMDESVERYSPCTKGLALATFAVDRLRGETYQRAGFAGDDASDFVAAGATPGVLDLREPPDPDRLLAEAGTQPIAASADAPAEPRLTRAVATSGVPAEVRVAVAGASAAPLTTLSAPGEHEVTPDALLARDEAYGLPYVRLEVALPVEGGVVSWSGRTVGRSAVRLSVWDRGAAAWRPLDTASGAQSAASTVAEASLTLSGRALPAEVSDGTAQLLVQVVPRADALATEGGGIAQRGDYDVALAHLTDTQYYSEAYPEVYAGEIAWILRNAQARKIGFAIHTGDLIQNWVDPDMREDRARREFAIASRFEAGLDEAGLPNSVLPGNHDNKRGVTNDLFNEYFGPSRYAGRSWYGGSVAPDDNSASWSWFQAGGARFVVLSLPYAYGEREIVFAEQVVAQHPDANIVIATHEHVAPKSEGVAASRSNSSRWVSHADLLWNRVIAPNRNVVLVLSGHFHGIGAIVTEDAGGIPGHTVVEALADYQEFRTHTGERATGFQRLLQLDLAAGMLAVDTFSVPLSATASYPFDYGQFVVDDGSEGVESNERPWNVVDAGLQHRYTEADDSFSVPLALQHAKAVETDAVTLR